MAGPATGFPVEFEGYHADIDWKDTSGVLWYSGEVTDSISFNLPELTWSGRGAAKAEFDLPQFTFALTETQIFQTEAGFNLPEFTLAVRTGGRASFDLPEFTWDATAYTGRTATLSFDLPGFVFHLRSQESGRFSSIVLQHSR